MREKLDSRAITHETAFAKFVKDHRRHEAYTGIVAQQHPYLLTYAANANSGHAPSQSLQNPAAPWTTMQMQQRFNKFKNFYYGDGDSTAA